MFQSVCALKLGAFGNKQNEHHSAFPYSRGINVLPQILQSQVKSKQKASFGSNCVQIAFAKLNSQQMKIQHILRLYVLCIYGLLSDAGSGSDTASKGRVSGAK
jgi:hypothetical protein